MTAGLVPLALPATTALPIRSPATSRATYAAISPSARMGLRISHSANVRAANRSIMRTSAREKKQKHTASSYRDSEVAQRGVQGRLLVGALFPRADDQRARRQIFASRELARPHPRNHHAARRDLRPDQFLAAPGDVVDRRRGSEHHPCAQHPLLLAPHPPAHPPAAADESAVLDDHRPR